MEPDDRIETRVFPFNRIVRGTQAMLDKGHSSRVSEAIGRPKLTNSSRQWVRFRR